MIAAVNYFFLAVFSYSRSSQFNLTPGLVRPASGMREGLTRVKEWNIFHRCIKRKILALNC